MFRSVKKHWTCVRACVFRFILRFYLLYLILSGDNSIPICFARQNSGKKWINESRNEFHFYRYQNTPKATTSTITHAHAYEKEYIIFQIVSTLQASVFIWSVYFIVLSRNCEIAVGVALFFGGSWWNSMVYWPISPPSASACISLKCDRYAFIRSDKRTSFSLYFASLIWFEFGCLFQFNLCLCSVRNWNFSKFG